MKLLEQNYGLENIVHVEWHTSQAFNNPDANTLSSYYGVTGVPDVYFDGNENIVGGGINMYPAYETKYLAHKAEQSKLIMDALSEGSDGVLVCGCHLGDCHYLEANELTELLLAADCRKAD